VSLTERDRSYVDRYTDLAKWLIGLSYALLVAVASRRFSGRDEALFRSLPFTLGVGLLILSLYCGFLSYQSILIVLSSKPLWMLRSELTSFPVAVQLWLLSGATALLAVAFFRGTDRTVNRSGDPDDAKAPARSSS
jgi:hypothetical protein